MGSLIMLEEGPPQQAWHADNIAALDSAMAAMAWRMILMSEVRLSPLIDTLKSSTGSRRPSGPMLESFHWTMYLSDVHG